MTYQNILLEKKGGIATITINRPDKLNALNADVLKELRDALKSIREDAEARVVIITGAGEKAFIAGADVSLMSKASASEAIEFSAAGQDIFSEIENFPLPVIASINGFALGGGCELAMACDIRIASSRARFAQPEINLGIIPGWGGTQRLPRLVGMGMAKELIFTGDMIDAATAEKIGLVNKVVEHEKLLSATMEIANKIVSKSAVALKFAKAAVNAGSDLNAGLRSEANLFGVLFTTEDAKEGLTAFLEKRKPQFKGK